MFVQTLIKELNLRFKIRENPQWDKKRDDYLTVLHLKLKS